MYRIRKKFMDIIILLFQNKNIVQELCRYNKEGMETAGSENCDSYSFTEHTGIKTIH
jgi:hypothetical protein